MKARPDTLFAFAMTAMMVAGLSVPVAAEQSGSVGLTVDTAGLPAVQRTPVSGGVPFPMGAVATEAHLRLKTAQGAEVPANYHPLARWQDGSIKSALISFVPSPSGNAYPGYQLDYGPSVRHATSGSVKVTQGSSTLTITTDLLKLQFSKQRFSVLEQVWTDVNGDGTFSSSERWLTKPADLVVVDKKTGGTFRSSLWTSGDGFAPRLIEAGPQKVTVLLEGRLKGEGGAVTADGADTLVQAKVWLSVYAGSTLVSLQTTLIDTTSRPTQKFSGRILKFTRIAVDLPLTLTGASYAAGGENDAVYQGSVGSGAHLLQDAARSFGTTFSYDFSYSGVGSGNQAPGWFDVSAGGRGVTVGLRHFWQTYPHKLAMTGGGVLQIEFLPSDSTNHFYTVYPGVGKTYEGFLDFHAGSFSSTVRRRAELALATPLLLADGSWYAASQAFGPLSARSEKSATWESRVERQFTCTALRLGCSIYPLVYGQRDFGDYQQGIGTNPDGSRFPIFGDGHYEDTHGFLLQFARTGDRKWFDHAVPMARHHYDLDVMHTENPPRYPGFPPGMIHWHGTSDHEGVNIELGHVVPGGLDEYYLLTGDPRALEVIREQGDWVEHWARAGQGRIAPEKSADKVRLEEYERVGAWTLYTVLKSYEVTGDPKYWEGASILVKNMIDWWKMPQDHIVFDGRTLDLTRPPKEQAVYYQRSDWTQGTGYPLPTLRVANCPQTSAPIKAYDYQTHAPIAWMSGLLQTGLIRYYQHLERIGGVYDGTVRYRGSDTAIHVDTATMREMLIQMANMLVTHNYLGSPDYPSNYPWLSGFEYDLFVYSVCPGRNPKSTDGALYLQWPLLFISTFDQSDVSSRWQSTWPQLQATFRDIAMRQYVKFVVQKAHSLTGYNGAPDLWNEPFAVAQMEALGLLDDLAGSLPTSTSSGTSTTSSSSSSVTTSTPDYHVVINDGNPFITSPMVDIKLTAPSEAVEVNISSSGYGDGAWQSIDQVHGMELPPGAGAKRLYVQFRDDTGTPLAAILKSVILVATGSLSDVELVLNDADDTYVFSNKPDSRYGGRSLVEFGTYTSSYDYIGLFRFPLPAVPPDVEVRVTNAALEVYLVENTRNTSQVISPYETTEAWAENAVTWTTRPALGASSIGSGVTFTGRSEVGRWKMFPLDPQRVQGWFDDSAKAHGIVLKGEGKPGFTSVKVVSSESMKPTEDRRPRLTLRLQLSVTNTIAPVISGIEVTNVGETSATIQWTTDKAADGLVEYGTTTAYGATAPKQTEFSTTHAIQLTNLTAQTTYHARITSQDIAGNSTTSDDVTVTTTGATAGDLNRDGQITVEDVALLAGQLVGLSPKTPETADVNGDGRVSVADLQALVNLL